MPGVADHMVPPGQVEMDGGALGSDGNRWVVLPDAQELNITPQVKGNKFYTFTATAQKYKLHIVVDDGARQTPLAEDRVTPTAHYCVGQYLAFLPMWRPSVPPGISKQVIQWGFDGNYVNDSWQLSRWVTTPEDPIGHLEYYGSLNYTNNPAMLTNENTHAWWVSGESNWPGAQYSATLSNNLTFSNGQMVELSRKGLFDMYRPSLVNWTQTVQAIVTDYAPMPDQIEVIRVGTPTGANAMAFTTKVISAYEGVACFTQVYDDQSSPSAYGSNVLDAAVVYPHEGQISVSTNSAGARNAITFDDTPSETANSLSFVSLVIQFRDYVRFIPNAGGPNIYITLGKVTWNVNATATYANGAWVLSPGSPVLPSWGSSQEFPCWVTVGPGH
jgi:hypothetical protein